MRNRIIFWEIKYAIYSPVGLARNFVDSGLRYEDAGSCYAEARNTGMEMREIGMSPPNFNCVPAAEGKDLKPVIPAAPRSSFPFN